MRASECRWGKFPVGAVPRHRREQVPLGQIPTNLFRCRDESQNRPHTAPVRARLAGGTNAESFESRRVLPN